MRCRVKNCTNYESGYCAVSSYIQIESDGTCSEIFENEDNYDEDDKYE